MKVELSVGLLHGQWDSRHVECTAEEFAKHEHDEPFWLGKLLRAGVASNSESISFVKVIHTDDDEILCRSCGEVTEDLNDDDVCPDCS